MTRLTVRLRRTKTGAWSWGAYDETGKFRCNCITPHDTRDEAAADAEAVLKPKGWFWGRGIKRSLVFVNMGDN